MKKMLSAALVVAFVAAFAASATAVTWTKLGTSGFTTDPATLQDWWRPVPHQIVVDDAGNIFTTANNANNRGVPGGITIYQAGGSKIDVDLNALGYPGAITKMVKAGDGKIYLLQNWREAWASINNGAGSIANFRQFYGVGLPDKILRIDASGSVTKIADGEPKQDGWTGQFSSGGGVMSIIDIDAGNKGIQLTHPVAGKLEQYYRQHKCNSNTIGARFKVSSFTSAGTGRSDLFLLMGGQCATTPTVVVGIDHTDSKFKLWRISGGAEVLQVLGDLDTNAWNEMYLYVNGPTSEIKVKWNGTEYSFTVTDPTKLSGGTTGWAQFGASTDNGTAGANTTIFDWVGWGKGYVTSQLPDTGWYSYNDGNPFLGVDGVTVAWDGRPLRDNNRIQGMAVGSDGNVYFTKGSINSYWKTHFIWRYNISTDTVEEGQPGVNNGQSYCVLFNDLDYFGKDAAGEDIFALLKQQDDGGGDWCLHPIKYTGLSRQVTGLKYASSWGKHYAMRTAFDPIRQKFWAAGWGVTGGWIWTEDQAGGLTGKVVDLGSGNKGLTVTKATDAAYDEWTVKYVGVTPGVGAWLVPAFTLAARFKIDAGYTGMDGARMMVARPDSMPKTTALPLPSNQYLSPAATIGIDKIEVPAGSGNFEDHWVFSLRVGVPFVTTAYNKRLVDLGAVVPGVYNEAYIYSERSILGTPRKTICWWNGTKVYDAPVADEDCSIGSDGSWVSAGNHIGRFHGAIPGTAAVTFDWINLGRNVIAPSDATKTWDYAFDGSILPQVYELKTNVMAQYSGDMGSGLFFNSGYAPVNGAKVWHTNNNNPQVLDHKRIPGYYWVTALSVNPNDGKAWMGWNAEATYDYGDLGHVITRDINLNMGDEGVPEAGAQVCALQFTNGKVYALVNNLTTGAYSLYYADAPAVGPQGIGDMRKDSLGSIVSTDAPKLVTYPEASGTSNFFYMQDDNGGIKVLMTNTSTPIKGDKVSISGILDIVDNELVIRATSVSVNSSGNADAKPVGMTVKSAGGNKLNDQPAMLNPYGPSNIGRLVKVTGKVQAYITDEFGSLYGTEPYWFTIDDGSGATTEYFNAFGQKTTVPGIKVQSTKAVNVGDMVSVVGVSTQDRIISYDSDPNTAPNPEWKTPNGLRRILPRNDNDVQVIAP